MKVRNFVVLVCFIVLGASCKQKEQSMEMQPPTEQITEDEALGLLHTWTDAYLKGNAEKLNDILDDTWQYSGSADGSTSNKEQTIDEFSQADYSFDAIDYEDVEVKLYGDVAVVRGKETMVILGSSKLDTTILSLRFTDVYQKKDGEIRAIATHSSPME